MDAKPVRTVQFIERIRETGGDQLLACIGMDAQIVLSYSSDRAFKDIAAAKPQHSTSH
jgi:hypothetical protein